MGILDPHREELLEDEIDRLELTVKRLQDLVASLERSVQWRDQQKKMLTAMLRRIVQDVPESAWLDKDFYEAVKVAGGGR